MSLWRILLPNGFLRAVSLQIKGAFSSEKPAKRKLSLIDFVPAAGVAPDSSVLGGWGCVRMLV